MNDKICSNTSCQKSLENNNAIYQCQKCDKYCCTSACLKVHKLSEHPINFHQRSQTQRYEEDSSDTSNSKRSSTTSHLLSKNQFIKKGEIIKNILEDPKYTINNFKFIRNPKNDKIICLGIGKYSEILIANHLNTGKSYAIKHIMKTKYNSKKEINEMVNQEIQIQRTLIHPNIIRLYSYFEDNNNYLIILEQGKKNLEIILKKIGKYKEDDAFNIFIQIVSALYFLHTNNLVHRNIMPENILINDNNEVKLCDFSYAMEINKPISTIINYNKLEYTPPEIIRQQPYDYSVDIWTIGVLLYELLHGYSPFGNSEKNNSDEIIRNIIIDKYIIDDKLNLSDECIDLIKKLLEFDCEKRIKIQQILTHPWILKYAKKYENNSNSDLMDKINNPNSLFKKSEIFSKIENDNKILFEVKPEDNVLNEYLNTNNSDDDNIFEKAIKKSHKKKKRNYRNDNYSLKNKEKKEKNELINSTNTFELLKNKEINANSDRIGYNKYNKKDKDKMLNDNNNININNINIYNSLQIDREKTQNNPNLYLQSGNFYLGFDTPNSDNDFKHCRKNDKKNLSDAIGILENAEHKNIIQKKNNKKVVLRDPPSFWEKLFEQFKCSDKK